MLECTLIAARMFVCRERYSKCRHVDKKGSVSLCDTADPAYSSNQRGDFYVRKEQRLQFRAWKVL